MKKLIRMACMALVAIAASVTVASCSKSDDNEGGSSASALGVVYGFSESVLDNYDLKLNYTDENGKTVVVDINKSEAVKKDTTVVIDLKGNTYTFNYYSWSRVIPFNKSLTNGEIQVKATKKSTYSISEDEKYDYVVYYGYAAVATNANKLSLNLKLTGLQGKGTKGSKFDEYVTKMIGRTQNTYTVSNGTISLASSSTTTEE